MLGALSKIKNLTSGGNFNAVGASINASLPLSFSVIAKTGFNRYELGLGQKRLRTRSSKALEIGANYWGEASGAGDSIIINNMFKKPLIAPVVENGLELAEKTVQNGAQWLFEEVKNGLVKAKSADTFYAYSQMLLSLSEGVASVGFFRNNRHGILQLSKRELYVIFDELGPVKFEMDGEIIAHSPFYSVVNLLNKNGIKAIKSEYVNLLWQPKNGLMDGIA